MIKSKAGRFGAFIATLGMSAGLIGTAVHATGAYFSDSKSGAVAGTIGSIKVSTSGGTGTDGLNFNFANMLPGTPQTATFSYQNTGANAEDVWLVFNDAAALHAINVLGTYGEAHVASNGTEIFASQNLNDNTVSCPPGVGTPACNALPKQIKLADNLAPGTGPGTAAFTFNYGAKLKGADVEGAPFGPLAYKIVATQHGIDPFNALNTSTP